jgi:hypothetical protein
MLTLILIVLLLSALVGGGFGHARFGYVGWSPAALLLLVLCLFYFTGNLHLPTR